LLRSPNRSKIYAMKPRKILARILRQLSIWAIKKHGMKIIVVVGPHGTGVTGELLASMLENKYPVRRQLERPFWDFSVPLSILGFKDKRRSPFSWLTTIFRSVLRLIFGRRNYCWIILQMNTKKQEIASYWSSIIQPHVTVLVNPEKKIGFLERRLIEKTQNLVVFPSRLDLRKERLKARKVAVGKDRFSTLRVLSVKELKNGTEISLKSGRSGRPFKINAVQRGIFLYEPLAISIGVLWGLRIHPRDIEKYAKFAEINVEKYFI